MEKIKQFYKELSNKKKAFVIGVAALILLALLQELAG
tara:strand:- start:453 stop:563 length:111 start_codon:yes stop_codon:yes gene_type:complete